MTQEVDRLAHTDNARDGAKAPKAIKDLPPADIAPDQAGDVRGGAALPPEKKRTIAQDM